VMQHGNAFHGQNVPAVGNLSRAIRPLTIICGITVPVSTRASEPCNAPRSSPPASAVCLRTPAPRRRHDAKKVHCGCVRSLTDEHLTATVPAYSSPASPCSCADLVRTPTERAESQRSSATDSRRLFPRRLFCRQRDGCYSLSHLYSALFAWQASASGSPSSQVCTLSLSSRALSAS